MAAARLKWVLIVALVALSGSRSFAQPSILKKEVNVSFDNITVEKLLIYLSNEAGFNFSYNSGIINVDQQVSYHGQHVQLEDVLQSVLPDNLLVLQPDWAFWILMRSLFMMGPSRKVA